METVTSMKQVSNQSFSKSKAPLDRAAAVAITSSLPCLEQSYLTFVFFLAMPKYTLILVFVVACVRIFNTSS